MLCCCVELGGGGAWYATGICLPVLLWKWRQLSGGDGQSLCTAGVRPVVYTVGYAMARTSVPQANEVSYMSDYIILCLGIGLYWFSG